MALAWALVATVLEDLEAADLEGATEVAAMLAVALVASATVAMWVLVTRHASPATARPANRST